MRFRTFLESKNIFGFEDFQDDVPQAPTDTGPVKGFNVEQMMNFLQHKSVGVYSPRSGFINEMQWGDRYGAVKVEVSPSMTFAVKRLGVDLKGEQQWVTKKLLQLDRDGVGGSEDAVADEIHEIVSKTIESAVGSPRRECEELERLTLRIADRMRQAGQRKFIFEGVKKLNKMAYIIVFEVGLHGVEARDHLRIEQLQTCVGFDPESGMIRIVMQKIASPVGGPHSWTTKPADMDLLFFPTQEGDEIAEAVATKFRHF
jgi:hypothetical protein